MTFPIAAQVTGLTGRFMDTYGPYAFGVMSLVILVSVLVWASITVWNRMVKPHLESQAKIAQQNASAMADLRVTSENLKDAAADIRSVHDRIAPAIQTLMK